LTPDDVKNDNIAVSRGVGGVTKFIEERIKLVRSLAEKADPFIKPRLLALAERYEGQLSRTVPTTAFLEIGMPVNYPTRSER
jgi:hypothetical protein